VRGEPWAQPPGCELEAVARLPATRAPELDVGRLELGIEGSALGGEWISELRQPDEVRLAPAQRRDFGDVVAIARRVHPSDSSADIHREGMLSHSFANLPILKLPPMDEAELLTVSQAAEAFSATSQTIRNWIRSDRVRAVRIGNRFLIPRSEVERLRGDLGMTRGESNWEHQADQPPEPLIRRPRESQPAGDPTDGLLGA
jgi:excisionase family DNA binding protein